MIIFIAKYCIFSKNNIEFSYGYICVLKQTTQTTTSENQLLTA